MLDLLGRYEAAFGQSINRQKNPYFFRKNTRQEVRQAIQQMLIQQMLGGRVMTDCEKYLGLPMATGKSKVNTFKELQQKITKRMWGGKRSSYQKLGGKSL